VFCIDSPGSYSVGGGAKVMSVKGCGNQSIAFDPEVGFQESSRLIEHVAGDDGFVITAVAPGQGSPTVERRIRFCLGTEELSTEDQHCTGGTAVSQYLLNPRATTNYQNGIGIMLECEENSLSLSTSAPIEVDTGFISFARHELDQAAILRLKSFSHCVAISVATGLTTLKTYISENR
jgi:hypothetical protein